MSNVFEDLLGFAALNTGAPAGAFSARTVTAAVTAAGSTQGTATVLVSEVNVVTSGGTTAAATGVSLPAISFIGQQVKIINNQGSLFTVYGVTNGTSIATIDGTAGTTGVTVAATANLGTQLIATTLSTWIIG